MSGGTSAPNLQSLCAQALQSLQRGNAGEVERLCAQILAQDPGNFTANQLLALLRQHQGRNTEALAYAADGAHANAASAGAQAFYGFMLQSLERDTEALASYDKALAINPRDATVLYNRGVLLGGFGRLEESLASYDRAIAVNPRYAEAFYNRAATLHDLKRLDAALKNYDQALAIKPDFVVALGNRGIVLADLGRFEEALASYDKALALKRDYVEAHYNRGAALADLKRFDEALASYDRAVALRPDYAEAFYNRGIALAALKRFDDALASYERALVINPRFTEAWNNRGGILVNFNRNDEALACFDHVLKINPNHAGGLYNRGNLQWTHRRDYSAALHDLEKLASVDPDYDYARGDLLYMRMHGADWRDFDTQLARIDAGVRAGKRIARPFVYQAMTDSPAALRMCSRILAAHQFPPASPVPKAAKRTREKIRIGYVSGEFRDQATAYLTVGLYEHHDKTKFEIIALDSGRNDNSPIRRRLEAAFDKMIDIAKLSDEAAARLVAAEEIDILVNLNGYFGKTRMGIFAQRPAPVQVNYLGFPATLGAPYIDYIVADRIVIPEDERQFYDEQVVYLPDSYQANDARRPIAAIAPSRADAGLPEAGIVFCNFNQSYKLVPDAFAAWMRILKQTEGSVLWLLQMNDVFPVSLRREAERQGVAGERLIFAPHIAADKHLARLACADLFLDSLPYNAHTTASDSLWAGVPLVTCRGNAFPGRVAASLLSAAGLPELITDTLPDYEALAVNLARDPALLSSIRQKLARNRGTCALFDTDRFRRNMEAAYVKMMDIARRGETPRSFAV